MKMLALFKAGSTPPPPNGEASDMQGRMILSHPLRAAHKRGLRDTPDVGGSSMRLSAPIFRLKDIAKKLARKDSIPLHAALDRIA